MPLLAEISTSQEIREVRAARRRTLRLRVPASTSGNATEALVYNLSEHGLLVQTEAFLSVGDTLEVQLPGEVANSAVVVWTRSGFAGCEFQRPVTTAIVSAALLRAPAMEPIQTPLGLPNGETKWDYDPIEDGEDFDGPSQALVIASLVLALVAVTIFVVALLSFPFSLI